ncbi:MAG TPA: hypothetical protein VF691_16495 [Cytophagaceae bacterium]
MKKKFFFAVNFGTTLRTMFFTAVTPLLLTVTSDLSAQNIFPSNGNVGVGTNAPGYQLDVQSTGFAAARIKNKATSGDRTALVDIQNGDAASTIWSLAVGGTGNGLGLTSGQFYIERVGIGSVMTMTNNGNVGIGTTPAYKLDIGGRARIKSGGGTAGLWFNNNANTAERAFVGMVDDDQVGLWGNGGAWWGLVMNVNNGSVGIGTTAPSSLYKLSVNGSIRAKEVVVESGWADFVFDSNYKLKSLTEVENYIKENNHLPDVPSAKEVQANGVKLGEIEATLLQKIEELTLYAIEAKKQVEALQGQVKSLESKVSK